MDAPALMTEFDYGNDHIKLYATTYAVDNTKAIIAEDQHGERFATVTINLSAYNVQLADDEVVLNHDILGLGEFAHAIHEALGYPDAPKVSISYGFAYSFILKLRAEYLPLWKEGN